MGGNSKYILDDFQKVSLQCYRPAVEYTRQLLSSHQCQYEELTVSEAESVFLVEDAFAIYVGIVDFTTSFFVPKYTVLFEELLFNPFPHLKHTLLQKDLFKSFGISVLKLICFKLKQSASVNICRTQDL